MIQTPFIPCLARPNNLNCKGDPRHHERNCNPIKNLTHGSDRYAYHCEKDGNPGGPKSNMSRAVIAEEGLNYQTAAM